MTSKASKKNKKPLQTTLGKAANQSDNNVDLSHVRRPIHTNIFGLHQVLSLFQTATKEVQNYIMNECDVMYECRICRTIFRSLANFILHKRNYCKEKYGPLSHHQDDHLESESISVVNKDKPEKEESTSNQATENNSGGLATIVQKLKDQQSIKELTKEILNEDLSQESDNGKQENDTDKKMNKELLLEEIATNNAAVFQTLLQSIPNNCVKPEYIKSEIMEIHGILDNDEAVLGPDGKVCNFSTKSNPVIPKQDLTCTECNMKFSTKKTLIYHVKYKHNNTRLVYVCPDCKDTFANAWCVYRHLYKIHRRTTSQIRRLREQIHNSVVRKDQEPSKKRDKKEVDNVDEENQWLNNIEGDKDFQMCGGCGKRFERKAALHSHAQMCQKRIAVCNTIKENNAKRKEEESKDKIKNTKIDKTNNTEIVKGASKRKPYLLRTYKSLEEISGKTNLSNDTKNICDVNSNSEILKNCDISSKHLNDNSVLNSVHSFKANSPLSDDQNSPENYSPFEQIDTEKMLSIIGVNRKSPTENNVIQNKKTVDKNSRESANNLENPKSFLQKLLQVNKRDSVDRKEHDSKPENSVPALPVSQIDKVTIRHLDDLLESPTSSSNCKNIPETLDKIIEDNELVAPEKNTEPNDPISEDKELSKTVKANVSPKILRKVFRRPAKRKRTLSLDVENKNVVKLTDNDSLWDKQDINFMSKAAPYMNQNDLTCIPCQIKYSTLPKLLWHMSAHFSWFRFQCSRCSFISFSKSDCSIHARINHNISPNVISSVVLPIPNWKIALMSHDFSEFEDKIDLSGRHTDENISCGIEPIEVDNVESSKEGDVEFVGKLFADSEHVEIEIEDEPLVPYPIIDKAFSIKNESIDIMDEEKDSFQVDLPLEIYSPDIYEIISIADSSDERQNRNVDDFNIDVDDLENEYFIPKKLETMEVVIEDKPNEPAPEVPIESIVKEQVDYRVEVIDSNVVKSSEYENVQKYRPKRNRMRSVKTLQDDFVYDLSKVLKLNDTVSSKTSIQKQKKVNNVQKTKVSIPPNSNSRDLKESLRNKQ